MEFHISRILFSTNRLYGSRMYCGRLQKNTNCGYGVGSWVIYFIFIHLPFTEGGGFCSFTIGRRLSFSSLVDILCVRHSYTCLAVSSTLNILCLFSTLVNCFVEFTSFLVYLSTAAAALKVKQLRRTLKGEV